MTEPFVSVIICTRDRAGSLAQTLESIIVAAEHVKDRWELIVVDNGSTDETAATIAGFAARLPIRRVWQPVPGLSNARNAGIGAARGGLLLLTDDDCRVGPDYLRRARELDERDGGQLVLRGGRVTLGSSGDLPLSIKDDPRPAQWLRERRDAARANLGDSIIGCNMMMRRELFLGLGPFDERLGAGTSIPGGEDTDYIIRAYRAGFPIVYSPELCVAHYHGRRTRRESERLLKNYAIGTGALFAKYAPVDLSVVKQPLWDLRNWLAGARPRGTDDLDLPLPTKLRYQALGAWRFMKAPRSHPAVLPDRAALSKRGALPGSR